MTENKQHRLFIECYDGVNLIDAMRVADYQGTDSELKSRGNKLLNNPSIVAALNDRSIYSTKLSNVIADREERQEFWTDIMRNTDKNAKPEVGKDGVSELPKNVPLATRLRASELLGKSEADFMERLDITGNVSVTDIITEAAQVTEEQLQAIEADYKRIPAPKEVEAPTEEILNVDDLI